MDNQHRKISGYRELSETEIALMNRIKAMGPELEALARDLKAHVDYQYNTANVGLDAAEYERLDQAKPHRWLRKGEEHLQQGLMALTRAVVQPSFF